MSGFDITFTGETLKDDPLMAVGVIQLGVHRETFHSVLGFWSVDKYEAHWVAALRRLVEGAEVSCLLTSIPNPAEAEFFIAWPLYRSGSLVHVQNELIFADELDREFNPRVPWEYVGPRITVDEDGSRISEWQISCAAIEDFIAKAAP